MFAVPALGTKARSKSVGRETGEQDLGVETKSREPGAQEGAPVLPEKVCHQETEEYDAKMPDFPPSSHRSAGGRGQTVSAVCPRPLVESGANEILPGMTVNTSGAQKEAHGELSGRQALSQLL